MEICRGSSATRTTLFEIVFRKRLRTCRAIFFTLRANRSLQDAPGGGGGACTGALKSKRPKDCAAKLLTAIDPILWACTHAYLGPEPQWWIGQNRRKSENWPCQLTVQATRNTRRILIGFFILFRVLFTCFSLLLPSALQKVHELGATTLLYGRVVVVFGFLVFYFAFTLLL